MQLSRRMLKNLGWRCPRQWRIPRNSLKSRELTLSQQRRAAGGGECCPGVYSNPDQKMNSSWILRLLKNTVKMILINGACCVLWRLLKEKSDNREAQLEIVPTTVSVFLGNCWRRSVITEKFSLRQSPPQCQWWTPTRTRWGARVLRHWLAPWTLSLVTSSPWQCWSWCGALRPVTPCVLCHWSQTWAREHDTQGLVGAGPEWWCQSSWERQRDCWESWWPKLLTQSLATHQVNIKTLEHCLQSGA